MKAFFLILVTISASWAGFSPPSWPAHFSGQFESLNGDGVYGNHIYDTISQRIRVDFVLPSGSIFFVVKDANLQKIWTITSKLSIGNTSSVSCSVKDDTEPITPGVSDDMFVGIQQFNMHLCSVFSNQNNSKRWYDTFTNAHVYVEYNNRKVWWASWDEGEVDQDMLTISPELASACKSSSELDPWEKNLHSQHRSFAFEYINLILGRH